MKYKITLILFMMLPCLVSKAQDMSHLYAIGSAVPGGIQELTPFPNKQFKFAGTLNEGTLVIRNTLEHKTLGTRYLKPTYEDSYIVNNSLPFTLNRDSTISEWVVTLTEDVYRFTVDLNNNTLKGEIFRPWNELFIVGGATECGWVTYTFLPFTREENEICSWDWTGELKERPEYGEPRRFKFNGQNAWDPKVLHPFTSDEDILHSSQLLTGGTADNKWKITQEGYYHIRVDVFRETVSAEYLGTTMPGSTPTGIDSPADDITIQVLGNQVIAQSEKPFAVDIYNAAGHKIYQGSAAVHTISLPTNGMFIIRMNSGNHSFSKKIVI